MVLLAGQAVFFAPALDSQPPQPHSDSSSEFEAVSIKLATVESSLFDRLDALPGGRVRAQSIRIRSLVLRAYGLLGAYSISGDPGWLSTEMYDIEAKTGDARAEAVGPEVLRTLLQSMLAERFRFRAHFEPQPRMYFALVAAKPPRELKSSEGDGEAVVRSSVGMQLDPDRQGQYRVASRTYYARRATMAEIARMLNYGSDRPVLDETEIAGRFDISFTSEADDEGSPTLPLLNTALRDHLGLRLESRRGPLQVLVIDHIERPSPN